MVLEGGRSLKRSSRMISGQKTNIKPQKREKEEESKEDVAMTPRTSSKKYARRFDYSNSTQALYSCETPCTTNTSFQLPLEGENWGFSSLLPTNLPFDHGLFLVPTRLVRNQTWDQKILGYVQCMLGIDLIRRPVEIRNLTTCWGALVSCRRKGVETAYLITGGAEQGWCSMPDRYP